MSSSNQNILDADLFGFGRVVNAPERKVIILWDYENCPVPKGVSGLSAIRNIREAALKFGSIDQFEAYCDWSSRASSNIKNDLFTSGVKLRDCPKKGWIDTVGKAIVVDMMVYALERPRTTTVLLISGDRDHAYAISTLRNRGYPVKLIAPTGAVHLGLQVLVDLLDWNSIFKSDLPLTELADFSALAGGEEEETEEEDEETSEKESEDEDEDEDAEEKEMEMEETVQVQVGAEVEVEETDQLQAEAGKKMQVLTLLTAPQSEPVTTLVPTEKPPVWVPAEPALPSKVVPLVPLSALAQVRQEERPRSPPLPYRAPSPPLPYQAPSRPTPPQTVPQGNGAGSSQPILGQPLQEQPARPIPAKFSALVQELKALKAEGSPSPLWSAVCFRVYKRLPNVLVQAGVKKWKDYMLLAEKEGVVNLTMRRSGEETVSLKT